MSRCTFVNRCCKEAMDNQVGLENGISSNGIDGNKNAGTESLADHDEETGCSVLHQINNEITENQGHNAYRKRKLSEEDEQPSPQSKRSKDDDSKNQDHKDESERKIDTSFAKVNEQQTREQLGRPDAIKFPKLYRLLRENEDYRGLAAKNSNSTTSIVEHVANGSDDGAESAYISTCARLESVVSFRHLKTRRRRVWGCLNIVEIGVRQLPLDVEIIGLTTYREREKYIKPGDSEPEIRRYHDYAERFDEVLLKGFVPKMCVKKIYPTASPFDRHL